MINENKYFIFDRPYSTFHYYLKNILYMISSCYYKVILNLQRPKNIKKKKFYVSICAIFKNESIYIKEWIEYHKIIGINHFYLYNNFSSDNYKMILKPYIKEGLVTLIEWPFNQGQMSAYANCAKNFSKESNWIAYIDLDEYIVPNESTDIKNILEKFEKNRPNVIAYWKLFGSSGLLNRDRNGLVTEDFYLCWGKYTNIGKCFYNTAYDYAEGLLENKAMHCRWSKIGNWKLPPVNFFDNVIWMGINKANNALPSVQINHYFTKSFSEYIEKASRGDAFFKVNPRNEEYFYEHDVKCTGTDYNIRKYLIKLKLNMNNTNN